MKLLLVSVTAAAVAFASEVTPVQKVIQMLQDMEAKGKEAMDAEKDQYEKFAKFCESTLTEKQRSIDAAAVKEEKLKAEIARAVSDQERLEAEIASHNADIESDAADLENATSIRTEERDIFQGTLKDYTESIAAIGRAVSSLREERDGKRGMSLAQLSTVRAIKGLSPHDFASIDDYIKDSAAEDASSEKDTASLLSEEVASSGSEASSGNGQAPTLQSGILPMLQNLQDKFLDERTALEKKETEKKHAFDLLSQRLTMQKAQSEKNKREKSEFKARRAQDQAKGEAELEETTQERMEDQKYRDDLKSTCQKKASDFAVRQKTRSDELEALGQARTLVATKAAGTERTSFLQASSKRGGSALAFLRSEGTSASKGLDQQERVSKFLQQRATALNSRVLSALSLRVGADPFRKVKTMIENLIVKLREQSNSEATKRAWCDTEVATNKATREDKSDSVDMLHSEIDELTAENARLEKEQVSLAKEINELDAAMKEATELRKTESEKNSKAIKDAKEAQAAVAQALRVLKVFYDAAADSLSLAQSSETSTMVSGQPEVFGETPYTGMSGAKGGVVGMLEVIEADFARLEAETTEAEQMAKQEYNQFMEDTQMEKASKQTANEHKASKARENTLESASLRNDLANTQKELDAAMAFYEKLKPDCFDTGPAFAERKARTEAEIKDLEEALSMLGVEAPAA